MLNFAGKHEESLDQLLACVVPGTWSWSLALSMRKTPYHGKISNSASHHIGPIEETLIVDILQITLGSRL